MTNATQEQDLFMQGVAEFNRQQFFACHETLEELWNMKTDPTERAYVQGILQIAVGFYHWFDKQNYVGAKNKLQEGLDKLEALHQAGWLNSSNSSNLPTINLQHFVRSTQSALNQLLQLGSGEFATASQKLIPTIRMH